MNNMIWLIRRELWENRSLWIAPLVIAGVILVISAFGGVHVGDNDAFSIGTSSERHDMHGFNLELDHRRMIYAFALSMLTVTQLFGLAIIVFFYLLDSLLGERKDRSVLFWKSLPLSDTEVVSSKAVTALVVAPVIVLLVSGVMQILFTFIWSLRFGGTPMANIMVPWDFMVWLQVQAAFWLMAPATIVWYLPLAGYLLLVSVWARKNAFLWAVLPPVALLAIEGLLMQGHRVAEFLARRFAGVFQIMAYEPTTKVSADNLLMEVIAHIGQVFMHLETWAGAAVGVAMIFAAIRIRRYRDDN